MSPRPTKQLQRKQSKAEYKCKQPQTLIRCSTCNMNYDLKSTSSSTKTQLVMSSQQKRTWKCQDCSSDLAKSKNLNSQTDTSTPKTTIKSMTSLSSHSNMSIDYVTQRRTKTRTIFSDSSPQSLPDSKDCSLLSENSNLRRSLPDLSTRTYDDVQDLKQTIQDLQLQLQSAHIEIENLILEKNSLLQKISQQDLKLSALNVINTPSPLNLKKKKKNVITDPISQPTVSQPSPVTPKQPIIESEILQNKSPLAQDDQTNNVQQSELSDHTIQSSIEHKDSNKIYIYGSQQCIGLAVSLIKSRENSVYNKYSISSLTKPCADTQEVLKECYNTQQVESSKVIICVGENDSNPIKIIAELSAVLQKLQKCDVLVLNVLRSNYLNEKLLNLKLQLLCKTFKNCHFVKNSPRFSNYLFDICKNINYHIDFIDYKRSYLSFESLKRRLQSSRVSKISNPVLKETCNLKQKSILDYFTKNQETNISRGYPQSKARFFR